MNKLKSNIQEIQSFVNNCIEKGYTSYFYSFSVKREMLSADQARAATEKEIEKISDQLMILLRENPILKSLTNYIGTSDFLWDSTFIEILSSAEKKKYAGFNTAMLDTDTFRQNSKQYDEQLPYLSPVISYGILNRYIIYLRELIPAGEPQNKEETAPVTAKLAPKVIPASEPQDFESDFDDRQIALLAECLTELKIFKVTITPKLMGDILWCKLKKPLKISRNKNKLLAYFFSSLDNRSLITREWQAVCAKNGLFLSSGRGIVMQQGNFSSAVAQNNEFPPKDCEVIDNYLKQLKGH